jgi:hypothetical protein
MNKTLSVQTKDFKKITISKISDILLKLMKLHIGDVSAITKEDMYKFLFKENIDDSLKAWIRWDFVKKAMHKCRLRSKCFIVSRRLENGQYIYYVPINNAEIMPYHNMLDRNISKMEYMKKRAEKSIKEQWYRKDWEFLPLNSIE